MECLLENASGRLTEQNTTHVDFHHFARDAVFLNAVADVIELCECRAQLVEVVAEHVREEIVEDPGDYLRESNHTFRQFEFLFM